MSKSIIGYYSEPLTQVEMEEVYNILHPIFSREHTVDTNHQIERLLKIVLNAEEGSSLLNPSALGEVLTARIHELFRDKQLYDKYPDDCLKSLTIEVSPECVNLVMSDELAEFYTLTKFLPLPSNFNTSESYSVNRANAWLVDNPEARIFDKTEKALMVDKLNTAILQKLEACGYQSETNRPIYDFSAEILKSLN